VSGEIGLSTLERFLGVEEDVQHPGRIPPPVPPQLVREWRRLSLEKGPDLEKERLGNGAPILLEDPLHGVQPAVDGTVVPLPGLPPLASGTVVGLILQHLVDGLFEHRPLWKATYRTISAAGSLNPPSQ
jgi:hypothetical protein